MDVGGVALSDLIASLQRLRLLASSSPSPWCFASTFPAADEFRKISATMRNARCVTLARNLNSASRPLAQYVLVPLIVRTIKIADDLALPP